MVEIVPTIGRIVLYKLNGSDVLEINRRRKDAADKYHMHAWQRNGTQLHRGNEVSIGQEFPAMIVAVWGKDPLAAVNLKVELDGTDVYWATSRTVGTSEGSYRWMEYQKGQAAKTEAAEAALAGAAGIGKAGG